MNRAVFWESADEIPINKKTAPEFMLLYQQSVLLSLKEQGVITEQQYGLCLDKLTIQ